jgi:hypothetical protein
VIAARPPSARRTSASARERGKYLGFGALALLAAQDFQLRLGTLHLWMQTGQRSLNPTASPGQGKKKAEIRATYQLLASDRACSFRSNLPGCCKPSFENALVLVSFSQALNFSIFYRRDEG